MTDGTCCSHAPEKNGVALTTLRPGQSGVVCESQLDPSDAAMLRAMGLRPNATIRVCRLGEPCIVEVMTGGVVREDCGRPDCRCRIGLARPLAERVRVRI